VELSVAGGQQQEEDLSSLNIVLFITVAAWERGGQD